MNRRKNDLNKKGTSVAEHCMLHSKQNLQQAGITLVALVVTIIVLLILAGVTISLALGDNGIIGKAQEASNMYANATKDEKNALNELTSEIERLSKRGDDGEESGGGSTGPVIKDKDGATIDLANIASYYGHDVTYNGKTYQLFLVDTAGKYSNGESRIWLQYKGYVSGVKLSDHYETTGILTDNANSKLWEVNPDLKTKYQANIRAIAESNLNNNIKGVAYLCNTANWNQTYVGTEGVAAGAYAIGGVSAEMYCDSYNQARGKTSTDANYFDAKAFNKNSTYGYYYKPKNSALTGNYQSNGYTAWTDYSGDNKIQTSTCSGMYSYSTSSNPWLASPSPYNSTFVCFVGGNDGYLTGDNMSNTLGVRPAVSLPSNIQIQLIS